MRRDEGREWPQCRIHLRKDRAIKTFQDFGHDGLYDRVVDVLLGGGLPKDVVKRESFLGQFVPALYYRHFAGVFVRVHDDGFGFFSFPLVLRTASNHHLDIRCRLGGGRLGGASFLHGVRGAVLLLLVFGMWQFSSTSAWRGGRGVHHEYPAYLANVANTTENLPNLKDFTLF